LHRHDHSSRSLRLKDTVSVMCQRAQKSIIDGSGSEIEITITQQ
jgi:hypothetical protein